MSYIELLNDKQVINSYEMIESKINKCPIDHSLGHISRTLENAKILADLVNLNKNECDRLLCACVLHDIGYTHSRFSHATFGAMRCRHILRHYYYSEEDIEIISSIISSHNSLNLSEYEFKESALLMLADKLDIGKSRLNAGYDNENSLFKVIKNIDYVAYKRHNYSISIELNCQPFTSIYQLKSCSLISKLDDYFKIASEILGIKFKLFINIRKAPIKN